MRRIRGTSHLLFDLVDDTARLVRHRRKKVWDRAIGWVSRVPGLEVPAKAVQAAADVPAEITFAALWGTNFGVRKATDLALDAVKRTRSQASIESDDGAERAESAVPLRSDAAGSAPWLVDHAETILNGLFGSHLSRKGNELDLKMTLRDEGGRVVPVDPEAVRARFHPTSKLAIFVHGLSSTEWSWTFDAEAGHGDPAASFGTLLRADFGFSPVYVRYNSGRHVSENGRALDDLLESLERVWPVAIDEIALIGHSMGGLVIRSAAHHGHDAGSAWVGHLRHVFCLGSPHLGAPLERGVNWLAGALGRVETEGAQIPQILLNARSDGVKDLRFGYTLDEEWAGRDADAVLEDHRVTKPLLEGVGYYFVAATLSRATDHRWGQLVGDVLVRPPSAEGRAKDPEQSIPFRSGRILGGLHHLHLASHPEVYEVIRSCLEADASKAPSVERVHD